MRMDRTEVDKTALQSAKSELWHGSRSRSQGAASTMLRQENKQELVLHQTLSLGAHSNCGLTTIKQLNQSCKAQGLNRCSDGGGALDKPPPPCLNLENKQELVLLQILSPGAHSHCGLTAMKQMRQPRKAQGLNRCIYGGGALDELPPPC